MNRRVIEYCADTERKPRHKWLADLVLGASIGLAGCFALLTLESLFSHRRLVMGVLDSVPFFEYFCMTTRDLKPLPGMTFWCQWSLGDFEFYCPDGEASLWWLIVPPWFACLLSAFLVVHLGRRYRRLRRNAQTVAPDDGRMSGE